MEWMRSLFKSFSQCPVKTLDNMIKSSLPGHLLKQPIINHLLKQPIINQVLTVCCTKTMTIKPLGQIIYPPDLNQKGHQCHILQGAGRVCCGEIPRAGFSGDRMNSCAQNTPSHVYYCGPATLTACVCLQGALTAGLWEGRSQEANELSIFLSLVLREQSTAWKWPTS